MYDTIKEQLAIHDFPGRLVYATLSGSRLYGTATPNSDVDVRGIFQASLEDIVYKRDKTTYSFDLQYEGQRVDNEFTEFRKFVTDALQGQTYALDMLFANKESRLYFSVLGDIILRKRSKFLSKNMSAIVGYCITQAKKYSKRGMRYKEYKQLQIFLKPFKGNHKLFDIDFTDSPATIITKLNKGTGIEEEFVEIGTKLFPMNTKVDQLRISLKRTLDDYGDRAKQAATDGKDRKAFYHAYRLVHELEELWTTGQITFPLSNAEFLQQIRTGAYNQDDFGKELHSRIDAIMATPTDLPDEPDREYWHQVVRAAYLNPQGILLELD